MSARIAQRGIARSLSAFRACHWRERRSQKSLCRSERRRRAACGEAGSAALVCVESDRARPSPEHTFRERAFPPGAPLSPAVQPFPVVVRSSLWLVVVLVVAFRRGARLHAAFFEGNRGESRRYERSRVQRHPTHTDPPIYLLIQCNSMRLFYAHAARSLFLPHSYLNSLVLAHSLAYSTAVNTWRRQWGTQERASP